MFKRPKDCEEVEEERRISSEEPVVENSKDCISASDDGLMSEDSHSLSEVKTDRTVDIKEINEEETKSEASAIEASAQAAEIDVEVVDSTGRPGSTSSTSAGNASNSAPTRTRGFWSWFQYAPRPAHLPPSVERKAQPSPETTPSTTVTDNVNQKTNALAAAKRTSEWVLMNKLADRATSQSAIAFRAANEARSMSKEATTLSISAEGSFRFFSLSSSLAPFLALCGQGWRLL